MSEKTDEQKLRARVAAACRYNLYVIVKRGLYYHPDAHGYTSSLFEAWKLPKEQAQKYEMYADRADVPYNEKVLIEPAPSPDYPNSLDAIAAAVRGLPSKEQNDFDEILLAKLRRAWMDGKCIADLTARDWCEAFLAVVEENKEQP